MYVYIPEKKKVGKLKEGVTLKQLQEKYPNTFECDYPSDDQIEEWVYDSVCETPCGCRVEPDGHCEHGNPSWLIILGLI